ncbi:MAG: sugar ABC transporter permease [Dictyoglomi bacterium]|nr:sugar ABC transporter permease [Dictyoglomota bacterium]
MNRNSLSVRRRRIQGFLFISPWLIGFIIFTLYPFISSIYYSFTSYDGISEPIFIGLDNYRSFLEDPLIGKALYNTFYYAVFSIPLGVIWGICVALMLNMKVRGLAIYRTFFYIPSIVPIVASSMVWLWLLNPQYGIINGLIYLIFKVPGPGWITDPALAKPSLILMGLWGIGQTALIYLAGLQDVPQSLYESAELDGASGFQKVIHITIPLISPVILFNVIMGLINTFQYFTQAYIMTGGGPADSTLFYALYLYNNAFRYFRMGYASAMAWIMFLIILVLTISMFRSSSRWVYYGGQR